MQAKKNIDNALKNFREQIKLNNVEEADKILKSIERDVYTTKFNLINFLLCQAKVAELQEKYEEQILISNKIIENDKKNKGGYLSLLIAEKKVSPDKVEETISNALQNTEIDERFVINLLNFMEKNFSESLLQQFVDFYQRFPNISENPNFIKIIPKNDDTITLRYEILKKNISSSQNQAKIAHKIIHLIYDDPELPMTEAIPYLSYLPADDPDQYFVKALVSEDAIEIEQAIDNHIKSGSLFFKFISDDLKQQGVINLKNHLTNIPKFTGIVYLICNRLNDSKEKVKFLQNIIIRFPNDFKFTKLLAELYRENDQDQLAISTFERYVKQIGLKSDELFKAKLDFMSKISNHEIIDSFIKESITKFGDKLLQQDIHPSIKAEYAFLHRDTLGDEAEQYIIKALKPPTQHMLLLYSQYLSEKGQEDKALTLIRRASEMGNLSEEYCDKLFKFYIDRQEPDYNSAIQLCLKNPKVKWAAFRAGIIFMKFGDYKNACDQLLKDLRYNPDHIIAEEILLEAYIAAGRYSSAKILIQDLKTHDNPPGTLESHHFYLQDYESMINFHQNTKISIQPSTNYPTAITPLIYVKQKAYDIIQMVNLGRFDSALLIAKNTVNTADTLIEKYSNFASVNKSCGDFYLQYFKLLAPPENIEFWKKAISCYKKRCELDNQANSFIDLAAAMASNDKIDLALQILQKAVVKFHNCKEIWDALGKLYAITKKETVARHCFTVATKLSSKSEYPKSYFMCAAIAFSMHDYDLVKRLIPLCEDDEGIHIFHLKAIFDETPQKTLSDLMKSLLNGGNIMELKELPILLCAAGQFEQAQRILNVTNDTCGLAYYYEGIQKYEEALNKVNEYLEQNNQTPSSENNMKDSMIQMKERLECLLKAKQNCQIIQNQAKVDIAENVLNSARALIVHESKNEVYSAIASAIHLSFNNLTHSQMLSCLAKICQLTKENNPDLYLFSSRLIRYFLYVDKSNLTVPENIQEMDDKDPICYFLTELTCNIQNSQKCSKEDIAKKVLIKFPKAEYSHKLYLSYCINSRKDCSAEFLSAASDYYAMFPGRNSLLYLAAAFFINNDNYNCQKVIRNLCILSPDLIPALRPLIQ